MPQKFASAPRVATALYCSLALSATAATTEQRRVYNLPAGDAATMLHQFGEISGRHVIFMIDKVRGERTNAVSGEFFPREALDRMLSGTALYAQHDEATGAIVVSRRRTAAAPIAAPSSETEKAAPSRKQKGLIAALASWLIAAPALPAAESTPEKPSEEVKTMSVFTVTDSKDVGYRSTQTVSGSRTVENLRDTPNSISILNREFIDDLNATTMAELSQYSLTGEITDNSTSTIATYVFRGIPSVYPLRDGVLWLAPIDTYNIERVELLRGPNAFLYGEGAAGGSFNQLTKKPRSNDFTRVTLMAGSDQLHRIELDVNRQLTPNFGLRANAAIQGGDAPGHYTGRRFRGLTLAAEWRPTKTTVINVNGEAGRINERRRQPILRDAYTTTDRTGAATAITATAGGMTYIPASGALYNATGTRRSSGTNIIVTDDSIIPRDSNFFGPDAFFDVNYDSIAFEVEQRVGENLSLQASAMLFELYRNSLFVAGTPSSGIYRDTNRNLPDGSLNPYFNELYTEYYFRRRYIEEPRRNARVAAVYNLTLPFTTQKIIATATYNDDTPKGIFASEFVDPTSALFAGALINDNTLAAYQANVTTMNRNFFYRRHYLRDGDSAKNTAFQPIAGRSVFVRDPGGDGAAGRVSDRKFKIPGYGIGASGTYWGGRIHSLVGWRYDAFIQNSSYDFYNPVTGEVYELPTTARTPLDYGKHSYNGGLVFHASKAISVYANYAQNAGLSSGVGAAGYIPGTVRGVAQGDGYEYGLRWSFLDGRIETNWTYYITNGLRNGASPGPSTAVINELTGIFAADFNPGGADTQTTRSTGLEFETTTNLTQRWRLTWNISTNELETADRYPHLKEFQSRAAALSQQTPELDNFLSGAPNGVPLPGFTKTRSNLVTNYSFGGGWLKGVSIGGGLQYRDKSFQGIFDLNRDGFAEKLYAPGYTLWNFRAGYTGRLGQRRVDYSLTISNLFDKVYYRSSGLQSGSWGDERTFRVTARTQF